MKAKLTGITPREDSGRLSDRVTADLERLILQGELAAGTQLPTEAELCDLFGVSRTVIRDAVRTLAVRGLLDVRPGRRGTTIQPPSDAAFSHALLALLMRSDLTLGQIWDARSALEMALVPLAAARATPEQQRSVGKCFEQFRHAAIAEDWSATHRTHLAFHVALLRATNLPALDLMLKPLHEVIVICSAPAEPHSTQSWQIDEHAAIRNALLTRDEDAVRAAMLAHFTFSDDPPYAALRDLPFARTDLAQAVLTDDLTAEALLQAQTRPVV
jgi:DNA-binding FadR family transcriptional regulator